MLVRRLFSGLFAGLLVGGVLAAVIVAPLKTATFEGAGGSVLAYGAAALVGALTGLVTGKPIWAADAKIEAGLKAFFGVLLACGGMFALRRWVPHLTIDLRAVGAGGPAPVGALPAAALPILAAALGALFELDNTDASTKHPPSRGAAGSAGREALPRERDVRVSGDSDVASDPAELASSRHAKR
jgi:hypothetical protein